jgi:hypothetical protein
MKALAIAAQLLMFCTIIGLAAGHLGAANLDWTANQISTFAALGPHGYLISFGLMSAAGFFVCIGILVGRSKIFSQTLLGDFLPMLAGAAFTALLLLANFKETATSANSATASAIRQQATHDAGLLVLIVSLMSMDFIIGWLSYVRAGTLRGKLFGLVIVASVPISMMLLGTNWPTFFGLDAMSFGIKQRAFLTCLWIPQLYLLIRVRSVSIK